MLRIKNNPKLKNKVTINYEAIYEAGMKIRAVNHPLRKEIIELIDSQKEMIVTDIFGRLKLEQAVASQQLKILRLADMVKTRREGKCIHYSINYENMKKLTEVAQDL